MVTDNKDLLRKLHNQRHNLRGWFQSEMGQVVMQYLLEQVEIYNSHLLHTRHLEIVDRQYFMGTRDGILTFVDLPDELDKVKIPTPEEEQAIAERISKTRLRSQAEIMGQYSTDADNYK